MSRFKFLLSGAIGLAAAAFALNGCATDGGYAEVDEGYYYGPGVADPPWFYHRPWYHDDAVIVRPGYDRYHPEAHRAEAPHAAPAGHAEAHHEAPRPPGIPNAPRPPSPPRPPGSGGHRDKQ